MRVSFCFVALLLFFTGATPLSILPGASAAESPKVEFTEWMAKPEFDKFLAGKGTKNEAGKNYWDQGHWIQAVEFRWVDGVKQHRISIGDSPKDRGFWWMWFLDMDEDGFQKRMKSLETEGYQIMAYHSETDPEGKKWFAATWRKIGQPKQAKAATIGSPATNEEKKPVSGKDAGDGS